MSRVGRRRFLQGGLGVAVLASASGCGRAPWLTSPKVPLVGYLDGGGSVSTIDAFRQGMRDAGYVEGQTVVVEFKDGKGGNGAVILPSLAAELVQEGVDVIVCRGIVGTISATRATATIPIVAAGSDIVGAGLITNLAHPEGNLTGVTTSAAEFGGKWVEILREAVPGLSRLAAVVDLGTDPVGPANYKAVEQAAQSLGLQVTPYDLRKMADLPGLIAVAKAQGAEGLVFVNGGTLAAVTLPSIGAAGLASGLPTISLPREFADAGGLLAYGPNNDALVRQSARLVDKLLKGAKVADVPVEKPTTFDFVINLKTAQSLGLAVPTSILQQANQIIQ